MKIKKERNEMEIEMEMGMEMNDVVDADTGMLEDASTEMISGETFEDSFLSTGAAQEEFINPISADGDVVGRPDIQAVAWEHQKYADNCAPTAEGSIIKQFGYDMSQDDFAYFSHANGWYAPGEGTSPADIGKMMDAFGIENHTVTNAGVSDLINELSHGHGVIVSVKADQLWGEGLLHNIWSFVAEKIGLDNPDFMPADHALCVTGFDFSDPAHPQVVLNDSGTPYGQGVNYPLDKFVDAWKNGGCYYTATDNPLPSLDAAQIADLNHYDWSQFEGGFTASTDVRYSGEQLFDDDFARMI